MAPAYANIVVSIFERKLLTGSCKKPLVWFCYIDNIAILTRGDDKLEHFLFCINSIHSCVQFTCNYYSKECVQFLWYR